MSHKIRRFSVSFEIFLDISESSTTYVVMKTILPIFALLSVTSCVDQSSVRPETIALPTVQTTGDQKTSFTSASGRSVELSALDGFVDAQMENLEIPGLSIAVISDGEIIYNASKGVENMDTGKKVDGNSIFEAASLSKPVFAYFALKLMEDGVLDIDRPLHEYLPMQELEYDPRYHQVSARMVLNHTTGFPNWRWFDPAPAERKIERGTMYMKHDPGTFGYAGEGYNYLALVIAHLTNRDMTTIDALFRDKVAEPLDMEHSSFIKTEFVGHHKVSGHKEGAVSDDGWPRSFPDDTPMTFGAAGRLHTNALEYARFMIALMDGKGLKPSTLNEMLAQQVQIPADSETTRLTGETAWGLGIAIEPTPYGFRYEHGGNNGDFQSGMMFFRDRKLGYVFFTNSDRGETFNRALESYITEGQ